jgi:prepilin-type N-terminal cleavage/methylation domain-containing protein/prepilin-type processing-associated H-X9-DG protein
MEDPHNRRRAYTLTEVLVVCAIIGILASMLMPSVTRTIQNGKRTRCSGSLRQVGLVMAAFAHDHQDRYPQAVPRALGGVMEENAEVPVAHGVMALHPGVFQVLAKDFKTLQVLVCPSTRFWISRPDTIAVTNLSYSVNLHAEAGASQSVVATDSNLAVRWQELGSFPRYATNVSVRFTFERHEARCNAVYGDGHAESQKSLNLERPARPLPRPIRLR